MKCYKCSGYQFIQQLTRFTPQVKSEQVEVIIPTNICTECNTPLLSVEQVNLLRKAAADRYREKHGLLTSAEIIHFRESFGMSQKVFAQYLGVGEASIQRWETYYIQDLSQDDHIRVRCDLSCAERNLMNIDYHFSDPNIYNGMKLFSFDLFTQTTLYFIQHTIATPSLLGQLNFYADFLNFKKSQRSITGTRYVTLKNGPYPEQYQQLLKRLENQKIIVQSELDPTCYRVNADPDLSQFDDCEKKTLYRVFNEYQRKDGNLTSLSKNEKGYLGTPDLSYISYHFAKDLLI